MMMRFPALRGRMGARECFVAQFPLSLVPRLFKFTDYAGMPPEFRAQRKLVIRRIPEIAQYLLNHEDDWVFSSLTATFRATPTFIASEIDSNVGLLQLPLDTDFLLNDGQHRCAGIEEALEHDPALGTQTISVVLFHESSLERSQQVFSDLNRTVQKTSRSLDILYDKQDDFNKLTLITAEEVPIFHGRVEMEGVSLALRSPKFITLSALYDANRQLLADPKQSHDEADLDFDYAVAFWTRVGEILPQWAEIIAGNLRPTELRAEYVCGHAVFFWALGRLGSALSELVSSLDRLQELSGIDWRKTNPDWQGRCMLGPDIITRRQTRATMADYLLWAVGLSPAKPPVVLGPAGERPEVQEPPRVSTTLKLSSINGREAAGDRRPERSTLPRSRSTSTPAKTSRKAARGSG